MSKKKVLQAVATIGAVTATGAITTTAHADTTPATSNAAVSQAPSADQQLSNLQASQAKAEQSLADQNQAALKSQTATIEQQASEAANKENKAYSDAVTKQDAANQKELANAAQHIVTPAQKAQQESTAKSAYDKSKAALDAQHSAKNNQIKADYDAAIKKAADEAKANQTTAEQQHTQEVQDATKAVDNAKVKVNNLTDINNANQGKLNEIKERLNNEKDADNIVKFTITKNFPKDPTNKNNFGNLTPYWKDTNPADKVPITTVGNLLTGDTAVQAAIFAANVINYMRAQIGAPLLHVNQNSVDYTYQITKHYYDSDWDWQSQGHDSNYLNTFINNHNLSGFGECLCWVNANPEYSRIKNPTLADVKNQISQSIAELVFDDGDSDWGHMKILLGLDDNGNVEQDDGYNTEYIGVNGGGDSHFDLFYDSSANEPSDYTLLNFSGSSEQDTLKKEHVAALSATDKLASQLANAKTELANAQAKLANLQKSQGTSATNQALQTKLNSLAKTRDAAMQKENDSYNMAMNKLNADYQAKLDAIKKLLTNVDELKAQQQAKLDQLKKDHEAKLAQITNDAAAKIAAYKAQLDAKLNALKAKDVQTYQALHNELFP